MRRSFVLAAVLSGCSPSIDPHEVCVSPEGQAFAAERPVVVRASFHGGDAGLKHTECTISLRDGTLTIDASAELRRDGFGEGEMAKVWPVTCKSGPLAAGSYTVVFDGREQQLMIPGAAPPLCFGGDESSALLASVR